MVVSQNVRAKKGSDEKLKGLKDTIHTCIDNGILKDFLEHHKKEVETMLMTVFPPEQALEFVLLDEYNKGVEEGEARGEARGKARGIEKIARDMKKKKLPYDLITELTGLPVEKILAL